MNMLWASLGLVAGFAAIVWGADRFVAGASGLARNLGVSPLIIGLTIVGFGTSAPEMLISLDASLTGKADLAIGNAIGSNITNIALILGATALLIPLAVKSEILKREFPVLFAVLLLAVILMLDGSFSRLDGIILLVGLIVFVLWIIRIGIKSSKKDPMQSEFEAEIPKDMKMTVAIFWFLLGLGVLLGSSYVIVESASFIARKFDVPQEIIGLTIVAIGTSLPELAASIMSALKREADIAIGNVLGSNMFNILAVLMFPALIAPGIIPPDVITRDLGIMIGLTLILFLMAFGLRKPGTITRWKGGLLLAAFIGYQLLLFYYLKYKPVTG